MKWLTEGTRAYNKEMSMNMTNDGKATDQTLTEGAYAHGIGEGKYRCCNHLNLLDPTIEERFSARDTCPNWLERCNHNDLIETYERMNRRVYVATIEDWDDVEIWEQKRDKAWDRLVTSQAEHNARAERRQKELAHQRNKEKLHKGAWTFTLTYSPLKHGWDKPEAQAVMSEAIKRLRHYYRNEIEEFEAVGEWTQAGLPHIHGYYRLNGGKRITTKNFKRAYPIWNPDHRIGKGHEGGYHEPAKSDSDYSGYIQKDLDDAWLVVSTTLDANQAPDLPEAQDDEDVPADHPSPDPPSASG